ncbi:MAG: hypothetical protein KKD77_22680 [Gammaproteobacteria bacterium]|nr:hypothetical protein [Gammaproteobacteria bacterium]
MKVEVIERRANQVRSVKCPVCGRENTVVISEGKEEGSLYCWFCSSLLAWSIKDEVKSVAEKVEEAPVEEEVKVKKTKKKVQDERSSEGESEKEGEL